MSENSHTTANGHEIQHQREALRFTELQTMLGEYGIEGNSPAERVDALRNLSSEDIALFMTDMNRRLQGADETLVHEDVVKIGEEETIYPEDRYDVFTKTIHKIQNSSAEINPARIGDTLGLTTVLLHPFKDGNGRTARMFGFIFREDFDAPDAPDTFSALAESRDISRARNGLIVPGYVPYLKEGIKRSDPQAVNAYIDDLLSTDGRLYNGPYSQAPQQVPESKVLETT